jgi:hypothetical protein
MPSPPAGATFSGGWGVGLASGFLNQSPNIISHGSGSSAAGNIIADSLNASAALAAGAQASNEVLVSSISTAALAQLGSQARLRERDDVLEVRKAEEQGCTSSIALLTVRSAPEGRRIWRDLPVTMELTDAKRKQREAKRIAAKKALVTAANKQQQQQATHPATETSAAASPIAGTAAPSPVLSSNSSLTKLPAIAPRSGGAQSARAVGGGKKKKRQAYSVTEASIPCGSVSIELLLLPLFGTVAATDATHGPCGSGSDTSSVGAISHNKKQTKSTKNLRIGASELTPEEQQVVELELEREAEVAAAAMSMPPPSAEWVEQERRQHAAAASTMEAAPSSSPFPYDLINQEATVGGLRMQIAPAVRARAGQSVAQQAAAMAAAAAVAAAEQLEQHAGDGRSSRDGQTPHRSASRAAAAAAVQQHQRQVKKQNQPGGADWLKMDMTVPLETEAS